MKYIDAIFLFLPLLLWPITFILLKNIFIYSMLISTFILAVISLMIHKDMIKWRHKNIYLTLAMGVLGAVILYLIFYFGNILTMYMNINNLVGNVYTMIYKDVPIIPLAIILMFIGVFEEIYWRGALQGYLEKKIRIFAAMPWVGTTLYYSLIHVSTLNFVLVGAAFLVGLVTSIIAYKYGILSSMITHIVWIEMIVIFIPTI